MDDIILRGTLGEADARFFLASTGRMVEEARRTHDLSPTAAAALGRLLTGAVVMGLMLGDEKQTVTVSVKGGGPVGTLVAVADGRGSVKGYAGHPREDLPPRPDGKLDVGGLVGRDGMLTVVRETGTGEPYIGQCALRSGEIAEDLAWYFASSEQQPSLVSMGVLAGPGPIVLAAGGLFIQPLPGCSDALLDTLESRASEMSDISRLLAECEDGERLTGGLFRDIPWQVHERIKPEFRCDCSPERAERALVALGQQALSEMRSRGEPARVNCHFCGAQYTIEPDRLARLVSLSGTEDDEEGGR
jgi:molecular chaperone Hsp33